MPDIKRNIVFRDTAAVKLTMERILRQIMSTDIVDELYRYNLTDDKASKIKIYRSYPKRIEFYPSIVIIAGEHDVDIQSFGTDKETASEEYNNGILVSETATGYSRIPITLKIYAKSGDDRDNITGILVMLLRILSRNDFIDFGWNKIRVGSDQHMEQDRSIIYTNTITVGAHTDYTQILTIEQTALINKIIYDVTMVEKIT